MSEISEGDQSAESTASYYYAEGVAGEGETPDWFNGSKYKTVADQAKAYKDLDSKFGEMQEKYRNFEGAPEAYEAPTLENFELNAEDPMYVTAMNWAKETGINQDGFNSLMQLYAESELARENALNAFADEQKKQIPNYDARVADIQKYLKGNKLDALLEADISTAEQLEQFEQLLTMAGKASIDPNTTTSTVPSEEEIEKLMHEKDEHGRKIYNYDPARQAQVRKMWEQRVGKGPYHREVG